MFRISWIEQGLACLTHLCISRCPEQQLAPGRTSGSGSYGYYRHHLTSPCRLISFVPGFTSQSPIHIKVSSLFQQTACSLICLHPPRGPSEGYSHHNEHPGWCLWGIFLPASFSPWWDVGFTRFHARTSFIFLFGGVAPLGRPSHPKRSPFGVKLSRWSQSRALQGTG